MPLYLHAWRPYVSGEIRVHTLDVAHLDLLKPGPIGGIGAVIDGELRRLDASHG